MGGFVSSAAAMRVNERGGMMVRYTNKTGAASVKGTLVTTGSENFGVVTCAWISGTQGAPTCIGAIYEDGVADGDLVWVVISGPAQVLLQDSTPATVGYFAKTSDDSGSNGRADCQNAAPIGGFLTVDNDHFQEIGHVMETKSAGVDVLCWVNLHFN
jgi:hypothetical protein